jgi:hypothetical protein
MWFTHLAARWHAHILKQQIEMKLCSSQSDKRQYCGKRIERKFQRKMEPSCAHHTFSVSFTCYQII